MSIQALMILLSTIAALGLLIALVSSTRHKKSITEAKGKVEAQLLLLQQQQQQQIIALTTLQQNLNNQAESLSKTEANNILLHEQNIQHKTEAAKLQTQLQLAEQAHHEKLALLDDAKTKLRHEFQELANQIFTEKHQYMTASNKEALDTVLKPMQKEMFDFRTRIDQVHKEDTEARSSLERHLSHLKELNQQMSQDALNLTQALKSNSKVQGNWGEMILERLLESSGLREGHEFHREKTFKNDEGKFQRPDVIINMPGKKHVIIDAKVSLTHYEQATSATDKPTKETAIKAHLRSLQTHIQTLADKRYDHIHDINSPDYVLMFMPIEGAYLMAIEADSSIFEAAFDKHIAVVTPSTLYATLKLVEQLWRYEHQSDNVAKLTKQAGNLHDKFVIFIKSFEDIETHLGRAQKSYHTALGQLKDGRGNLVNQVKTLADLSGKAKKEIPSHLLDESGEH